MAKRVSESYCIEIPSAPEATPSVRQRVTEHLRANGFGEEDMKGIGVALEEALLNAILHGNRNDPARTVRVAYGTADDILHVLVSDEGPGFDPAAVPDPTLPENLERPGGRGLLLILHYMSGALVLGKGNDLLMWKRRDGMAKPGEPRR
jgi:serine/threonine-protein kinase RsbW